MTTFTVRLHLLFPPQLASTSEERTARCRPRKEFQLSKRILFSLRVSASVPPGSSVDDFCILNKTKASAKEKDGRTERDNFGIQWQRDCTLLTMRCLVTTVCELPSFFPILVLVDKDNSFPNEFCRKGHLDDALLRASRSQTRLSKNDGVSRYFTTTCLLGLWLVFMSDFQTRHLTGSAKLESTTI